MKNQNEIIVTSEVMRLHEAKLLSTLSILYNIIAFEREAKKCTEAEISGCFYFLHRSHKTSSSLTLPQSKCSCKEVEQYWMIIYLAIEIIAFQRLNDSNFKRMRKIGAT